MIDSRTHAKIDVGLTALLAGLAVCPVVSGRTRFAAGSAAAGLALSSALTNYEGGVSPLLSLEQHRAADASSGAALLGLGWSERRGGRSLMLLGAAQLALALFSGTQAEQGPPETAYLPLDVPKPLAPDLWIVDSVIGPRLPVRMTVIRLPDGGLVLHSPTRHTPALQAALQALGPIAHVVAPSIAHWLFAKPWQDAVPGVVTWAAPGLADRRQVRRAGLRIDRVLQDRAPPEWGGAIEQAVVRGGLGFSEVAMLHAPSRTLMLTDLMQALEPHKLPWLLRPLAYLLGNTVPRSRAPAHLRALVRIESNRVAARTIVGWAPERVVVGHGTVVERDAAAVVRDALRWLER